MIARASVSSSKPSSMLTSAAARLISVMLQMKAGRGFMPLMGKFSSARCVCAA